MKKYIGCLIVLLLIFVPRTNSKYILSDAKNLGVKTPGFDVVETTNGPVLINDYKKDFIEIKIKNNGKKDAKGEIVIEGVKLQDVTVVAGKEETYKVYITEALYNKLAECDIHPVKVIYSNPYKISRDVTTIKKDSPTIHGKVKCMNLGNDKALEIRYRSPNSKTNGEGVYLFDETKNDTYPVYFFRGTHNLNNNIIYGDFCWKIVRTTETGGVRLVYNGKPVNGKCLTTTGADTEIEKSQFNNSSDRKQYIGYIYGSDSNYYDNIFPSVISENINKWYKTNIEDKGLASGLDKKSIYCGDRTTIDPRKTKILYNGFVRHGFGKPSLKCPSGDSYKYGTGPGTLKYPIALLSSDEASLAGAYSFTKHNNYYLYTNAVYWLLSPGTFSETDKASVMGVGDSGDLIAINSDKTYGVRPAITLKGELPVSGNGSKDKPFVIKVLSKEIILQSLGNDKEKGIDYNKANSVTNGEGVYLFDETKNDTHPVYFFRGTHNLNNNLLYANFCWKIVRTTETGGVRIVYNGSPVNGKCTTTTGTNTQIGTSPFNTSFDKKQYVGYMFGDDTNPYQNINDSDIKKNIDNWYKTNIKDKDFESSLDKKSIYCGDRTEGSVDGNFQYYAGRDRIVAGKPILKCPSNDSYGLEVGNRKLTYPVGLLSSDDLMLSGAHINTVIITNTNFYLYTNQWYWLLSPSSWDKSGVPYVLAVYNGGSMGNSYAGASSGVRPALTIAPLAPLLSGDGSQNNPYII